MQDSILTRIQKWFQINCNGDWEHSYGFAISTLSNPGWQVKIDLSETPLENLQFERIIDNGPLDWMMIRTKDQILDCACDPTKLTEVLSIFFDEIIPNYADEQFYYEVYVPLIGSSQPTWRPVHAKMLTEDSLEIIRIPVLEYRDIRAKNIGDIDFSEAEIGQYKTGYSVGNIIKTELAEMFNGTTLIAT